MSEGPFWTETGLILQKLSEADRVTLIQHQRKSEDAVHAEAQDMGRRLEREAIVAWLRDQASDRYLETDYHTIADKLASGKHEEGA